MVDSNEFKELLAEIMFRINVEVVIFISISDSIRSEVFISDSFIDVLTIFKKQEPTKLSSVKHKIGVLFFEVSDNRN